jgi:hypothetical protein
MKINQIKFIIIAIAAALSVAFTANAKNIIVYPGGSISEGIAQAKAGDAVLVFPGDYYECVRIGKSNIRILGINQYGQLPVIHKDTTPNPFTSMPYMPGFDMNCVTNVFISNFIFQEHTDPCIAISYSQNITVQCVTLNPTRGIGMLIVGSNGMRVVNSNLYYAMAYTSTGVFQNNTALVAIPSLAFWGVPRQSSMRRATLNLK